MGRVVYRSIEDLQAATGTVIGPSEWLVVDQERIDRFADATDDHQWIHVDPKRAASGPFGGTVSHGLLTLSLLPQFMESLRTLENIRMAINYGLNKVRFPAPVPVGSRLRARSTLLEVAAVERDVVQTVARTTLETEGSEKPACVADMVSRLYFD